MYGRHSQRTGTELVKESLLFFFEWVVISGFVKIILQVSIVPQLGMVLTASVCLGDEQGDHRAFSAHLCHKTSQLPAANPPHLHAAANPHLPAAADTICNRS